MLAHSQHSLIDGVLYYSDNLLFVPHTGSWRHFFEEAHNSILVVIYMMKKSMVNLHAPTGSRKCDPTLSCGTEAA